MQRHYLFLFQFNVPMKQKKLMTLRPSTKKSQGMQRHEKFWWEKYKLLLKHTS